MEVMEVEEADLSMWMGKPPKRSKLERTHENTKMISSGSLASEHSGIKRNGYLSQETTPKSEHGMNAIQGEELSDRRDSELHSDMSVSAGPITENKFYIDIPKLDPEILESYEYLPGHFTAQRILFEHDRNKFLVKLASGEKDWVSLSSDAR